MELELKKTCLDHYETGGEATWTQEETAETIVPDYCPDIARIITANGCTYLHSRELRDGKVELSGTLRLTVLYIPEKEGGIRTLDVSIPFTAESDRGSFAGCQSLFADTQVEFLETRMLNPRKIFTHCKLVHRAAGYRRSQLCFCSDVEATKEGCVEKRLEEQQAVLLTAISEKDFTFTEEMVISAGRCGAAELLHSQVTPTVTETKLVGSKLIFKGVFHVQILYRGTDGTYAQTTAELPFSQIMEAEPLSEQAAVSLALQITGAEIQLTGEADDRQIGVTLYLHAAAQLRENVSMTLLCDLYSTAWETSYEAAPLSIVAAHSQYTHRQSVREMLEMGAAPESLLALWVRCGPVSVSREEKSALRTTALVRALVLDENGAPMLAERRVEVMGQAELPKDRNVTVRAYCPEIPTGTLSDRGVEVRFPVEFALETTESLKRVCISAVRLDEDSPRDMSGAPSLVLRRLGQRETAWELAKNCNSTITDLLAANQLESERDIPRDRLLLIPRKRA